MKIELGEERNCSGAISILRVTNTNRNEKKQLHIQKIQNTIHELD